MSEPIYSDEYWMQLAFEQAALAASKGEIPVGAVIVSQTRVIGTGYTILQHMLRFVRFAWLVNRFKIIAYPLMQLCM